MDESLTLDGLKYPGNMANPRLRWDKEDKLKNLVQSMLSYKSEMESDARMTPCDCKLKQSNISDCKISYRSHF